MNLLLVYTTFVFSFFSINFIKADIIDEENDTSAQYVLEGRVFPLSDSQQKQFNWQANARIHVNGGEYLGFVRKDGALSQYKMYLLDLILLKYYIQNLLSSQLEWKSIPKENSELEK